MRCSQRAAYHEKLEKFVQCTSNTYISTTFVVRWYATMGRIHISYLTFSSGATDLVGSAVYTAPNINSNI